MDELCVNIDKMCACIAHLMQWIAKQETPPVIFAAYHRTRSANPPSPFIGFVYQDGAVCDWWELDGVRHPFQANSLALLSAHAGSRSAEVRGDKGGLWVCSFTVGAWEEFDKFTRLYRWQPKPVRDPARLCFAFREVAFRYMTKRATQAHGFSFRAALLQLFAIILEEYRAGAEDARIIERSTEKAMQFMHANYHDHRLSLRAVSAAAGLSIHHFGRIFRRRTGMAPMKHLQSLRVSQSKDLLATTDLRVNEVARAVGFQDALHFSRVFHRTTGASPKRYRTDAQKPPHSR